MASFDTTDAAVTISTIRPIFVGMKEVLRPHNFLFGIGFMVCLLLSSITGFAQEDTKTSRPFAGIHFACTQDSTAVLHNLSLLEGMDSSAIQANQYMYYKLLGGNYFRKFLFSRDSISLERCIHSFEEILRIAPKDANTWWNLGVVLIVYTSDCKKGMILLHQLSKRQRRKFATSRKEWKAYTKKCTDY